MKINLFSSSQLLKTFSITIFSRKVCVNYKMFYKKINKNLVLISKYIELLILNSSLLKTDSECKF